jgi:hypothetical protein
MEEDLNLKENGRLPKFVGNLKINSIFGKWKTTIICCFFKWKMTTVSYKEKLALGSPELGTAHTQLVFSCLLHYRLVKFFT